MIGTQKNSWYAWSKILNLTKKVKIKQNDGFPLPPISVQFYEIFYNTIGRVNRDARVNSDININNI